MTWAEVLELVGKVAVDLGTTREGAKVELSVEFWPRQAVWLRTRSRHELRIRVQDRDGVPWLCWDRTDPSPARGRPQTSSGTLCRVSSANEADLRSFLARWLSWRAR